MLNSTISYNGLFFLVCIVTNVSFSALFISAQEGQGIVGLNLIKTDGAVGPVSVQLNTMDGTAVGESYF